MDKMQIQWDKVVVKHRVRLAIKHIEEAEKQWFVRNLKKATSFGSLGLNLLLKVRKNADYWSSHDMVQRWFTKVQLLLRQCAEEERRVAGVYVTASVAEPCEGIQPLKPRDPKKQRPHEDGPCCSSAFIKQFPSDKDAGLTHGYERTNACEDLSIKWDKHRYTGVKKTLLKVLSSQSSLGSWPWYSSGGSSQRDDKSVVEEPDATTTGCFMDQELNGAKKLDQPQEPSKCGMEMHPSTSAGPHLRSWMKQPWQSTFNGHCSCITKIQRFIEEISLSH